MDRCPTCYQPIPGAPRALSPRELELVAAWWMTDSVTAAARAIGVSVQTAKNMLYRARNRSGVADNDRLVAVHMEELRLRLAEQTSHNIRREAA